MKKALTIILSTAAFFAFSVACWFNSQATVVAQDDVCTHQHSDDHDDAVAQDEYTTHYSAYLCSNCGFGNRKDNCCKCGKWCGSTKIPARLCSDCGFGNRKDNCCVCGKWCGSTKIPAYLCNNCGFGNRKDNCCKCGKWAP